MSRTQKALIFVLVSAALVALAATLDAPVARAAKATAIRHHLRVVHSFVGINFTWATVLKFAGYYEAAAVATVAAAVFIRRRPRWHAAMFVALCALLSAVNGLVKWAVGRARPFRTLGGQRPIEAVLPFDLQPFFGGVKGIFFTSNLCFPSGHATLAFALAASLAILFPRGRFAFYTIAAITAAERFLETAHWFSDCVAAAAFGVGVTYLVHWMLKDRLFVQQPAPELAADQRP